MENIEDLCVTIRDENEIEWSTDSFNAPLSIYYRKSGQSTSVRTRGYNQIVQGYFVDVFCEDSHETIINQKPILEKLEVRYDEDDGNSTACHEILAQIYICLEHSLKSRNQPLRVRHVSLDSLSFDRALPIVRHIISPELKKVRLYFDDRDNYHSLDKILTYTTQNQENFTKLKFLPDAEKLLSYNQFDPFFADLGGIEIVCKNCPGENFSANFCIDAAAYTLNDSWKEVIISVRVDDEIQKMNLDSNKTQETLAEKVLSNELLMKLILRNLGVLEIQKLLKVSRGIRHCLDNIKPDPHIETYSMDMAYEWDRNTITITVDTLIHHNQGEIQKIHCYFIDDMSMDRKNKFATTVDLYRSTTNDFQLSLKHQNTCLQEFGIIFHMISEELYEFAIMLESVLQNRSKPLKVKKLVLQGLEQNDVIRVLRNVDASSLEIIEVNRSGEFCLHKVSQLDQWKNAKHFIANRWISMYHRIGSRNGSLQVLNPSLNQEMKITHFKSVDFKVLKFSSREVLHLKTELLKSSILEKFKIKFRSSKFFPTQPHHAPQMRIEELEFDALIGEPYRTIGGQGNRIKRIWYFRMVNTDFYLHIILDLETSDSRSGGVIVFSRVEKESTPFF